MSLWKRAENIYAKYVLGISEDGKDLAVKIPYNALIILPWKELCKHLKSFFYIGGPLALILSLISVLLGMSYVCHNNIGYENTLVHCRSGLDTYIINLLVYTIIYGVFAEIWSKNQDRKQSFFTKDKIQYRAIGKFVLLSISFLLINMIPLLSMFILYVREPNPDWRIEVAFFAIVSLGFFAPFIGMRFYSLFSYIYTKETPPALWRIWQKGKGNQIKIIISIFIILITMVFVLNSFYYNYIKIYKDFNESWILLIITEIIYNIICLGFFCVFFNLCQIQQRYFDSLEETK